MTTLIAAKIFSAITYVLESGQTQFNTQGTRATMTAGWLLLAFVKLYSPYSDGGTLCMSIVDPQLSISVKTVIIKSPQLGTRLHIFQPEITIVPKILNSVWDLGIVMTLNGFRMI